MCRKKRRLPLKTMYYLMFSFLIVIPLLLVLIIALFVLNQQFKKQAVENIERAQDNIVTEMLSDIDMMSMRLSHLIYTNNNEIIGYAAGVDTIDYEKKYEYEQKLYQAGNLVLEPVKDIVSVGFYMKGGKAVYIKNDIKRSYEEIKEKEWYQTALQEPNTVCIGSYDTEAVNDLYTGGKKDLLILVFALSPDVTTDRSQKIEMVTFYQSTGAGDTIKEYNQNYRKGNNKLGITRIVGEEGEIIFSTDFQEEDAAKPYTLVRTPMKIRNNTWYIESYIKTSKLTEDFWGVAKMILAIAILIFLLAGYYSGYFLKRIVKPIEEISHGLRQVEEGNLDVHITPQGQFEVRSMVHHFNAMVRSLKALVEEYEERVRGKERKAADYFAALLREEMTPREVNSSSRDFFAESYAILGLAAENYPAGKNDMENAQRLFGSFERNPRFTARCVAYMERASFFLIMYRVTETDYIARATSMVEELQITAKKELGVEISAVIGTARSGHEAFAEGIREVSEKMCLRFLKGEGAVIALERKKEQTEKLMDLAREYKRLAEAIYIADEKNLTEEREKLFLILGNSMWDEARLHTLAVILAIGIRFDAENVSFSEIFNKRYDYIEKTGRIEDIRSLKLWFTNYFAWIMDYSSTKLNLLETDVIVKAKRYLADNYEDVDLSLAKVAEYVGLNEKYFTNRFTKETGENFSSYLTGLRMQKAKELLKTTTFKVYEISEMVGYRNTEHFNRMFKKWNGISPAQYRKTM